MKRIPALIAMVSVAGSALLAAPVAADPVIQVSVNGTPISSGGNGDYGQNATFGVENCLSTTGDPGYFGMFTTWASEPGRPDDHNEFFTDTTGSFGVEVNMPLSDMERVMEVDWYCAASPVTERTDPAILWMSDNFTFTIHEAPAEALPAARTSVSLAKTSVSTSSTTVDAISSRSTEAGITITSDPDGLPAIDKIGITRAPAAALKAKVDANEALIAKAENFFQAFYGRSATNDELSLNVQRFRLGKSDLTVANSLASKAEFSYTGTWSTAVKAALATATSQEFQSEHADQNYVISTFRTLAGRTPTADETSEFTAQLSQGLPKVQVVENIALTLNSASYWNVKALK